MTIAAISVFAVQIYYRFASKRPQIFVSIFLSYVALIILVLVVGFYFREFADTLGSLGLIVIFVGPFFAPMVGLIWLGIFLIFGMKKERVEQRHPGDVAQKPWTKQDLMEIAKWQKNIIWMMLATIVATFIFIYFATIITGIFLIYYIYKLADATRSSDAWVYICLAFIPFVGVFGLLYINNKATKILQSNGVKVGLLGAKKADFDKIQ